MESRFAALRTLWRKLAGEPVEDLSAAGDMRMEPDFGDAEEDALRASGEDGGFGEVVHDDEEADGLPFAEAGSGAPMQVAPGTATGRAQGTARVQPQLSRLAEGKRQRREAQPSLLAAESFELPQLGLLTEAKRIVEDSSLSSGALEQNARLLEGVLDDFGVRGEIVNVRPGPVVTLYELEPAPGIKSSRVIGLADDIARSMSAIAARVAVVPGRNAIGIELPNARRQTVYLRELLASRDYESARSRLALVLGKTIGGEPVIADLAKMPHLLVAGTTGSGKSVAINTMILSILYRLTPQQVRLIMIDPKMLELSIYDGIPHLLTPVVTDPKKAVVALKWTVREMEERYRRMSKLGVRNIDGYNQRIEQAKASGKPLKRTVQTGYDRETGEAIYETETMELEPIPFIVVIIDEMADLMMVAGKDIEGAIQRLAQMARAAGIHVIMATQRPSVDVITGTIKANFPTRISFQVTSKIDSRTILGEQGAEQLLGMGDMLYMAGGGRIQRVHGPFVSDDDVEKVVAHLKDQGVPEYLDKVTEEDDDEADDEGPGGIDALASSSDLYDQAVAIVLRDRKVSTSYIQRRLGIGYNRSASLIERMEKEGVIGPANQTGKREILVPGEDETI
jgi:S-DNA-T family DNA segregation ATPase FtsK/SpoIIIE